MVYDPGIPQPTDIISSSQLEILENFTQLNTQFSVDHIPLNAATGNGEHTQVSYNDVLAGDPNLATPKGSLYTKALASLKPDLFFQNDNAGSDVRRVMTIAAWATFVPTAVNGAQALSQAENIASVVRAAGSIFTFNFTNNLALNYGVTETNGNRNSYVTLVSLIATNADLVWRSTTVGGGAGTVIDPIATAGTNQVTVIFYGAQA
jgi:hypothetical protein